MKLELLITDDDTISIAIFDNGSIYAAEEKAAYTIENSVLTGGWWKEEPRSHVYTEYVRQCGGGNPKGARKIKFTSDSELGEALYNLGHCTVEDISDELTEASRVYTNNFLEALVRFEPSCGSLLTI